jgi:hypothetical protein
VTIKNPQEKSANRGRARRIGLARAALDPRFRLDEAAGVRALAGFGMARADTRRNAAARARTAARARAWSAASTARVASGARVELRGVAFAATGERGAPVFATLIALAAICSACGARTEFAERGDLRAQDASSSTVPPTDAGCAWGFAPLVSYAAGPAPVAVAIADLDNDGHADLAVNNYGGEPSDITLNTLRNRGDGTFAPWKSYPSFVTFSVVAARFNSDFPELVVSCDLFPNDGRGGIGALGAPLFYSGQTRCGGQDSFNNVVVADFDSDGREDFAWAL